MGAYVAPSVSAAGLTIPSYASILADNLQQFLNIYGSNQYVGTDSAIYQFISVISLKQSDTMQAIQLAYNQRSPATAVGSGLDGIVKLNGLARIAYSFSTALETINGAAGTIISNGFVQDTSGNQWALPSLVTIPSSGSTVVTVTCTTPGNIVAESGAISIVATPVAGWTSATNASAATPGNPVETDSQLRARQSISVELPSETLLTGTIAAILATVGVSRCSQGISTPGGPGSSIENPTNATDSWGNPAHSITMVVEGGTNLDVATAIYNNRGIGCLTNGYVNGSAVPETVQVVVTDPNSGYQMTISFLTPDEVPVFVGVYVEGLTGFTSAVLTLIQTAIVDYLNSLEIGETVTYSSIYGSALSVMPNLSLPQFSIKSLSIGTSASSIFTGTVGGSGGTGYVVNDVLTVVQSGASGGMFTVTAVGSGGVITAVSPTPTSPGTGYSVANNLSTTGGTGTGAEIDITAVAPSGTSDLSLIFYQVSEGLAANVQVASI